MPVTTSWATDEEPVSSRALEEFHENSLEDSMFRRNRKKPAAPGLGLRIALSVALGIFLMMTAGGAAEAAEGGWRSTPGLYAVFKTSEGTIVAELFPDAAPKSVENFVGLAKGTKSFTDPVAGGKVKRPYYDGTVFHRVIPNFMMQGGDPLGTGTGGPGFTIPDEFAGQKMKYDRPGRLAMARTNAPNSAGSQFFLTTKPYKSLDNQYTIFGQVVEGQAIVDTVCQTLGSSSGRPSKTITLQKLTIERIESKAKAK
jgi:peptidyl-prolyl cis-trans isomerase A (cyclophilin A)